MAGQYKDFHIHMEMVCLQQKKRLLNSQNSSPALMEMYMLICYIMGHKGLSWIFLAVDFQKLVYRPPIIQCAQTTTKTTSVPTQTTVLPAASTAVAEPRL